MNKILICVEENYLYKDELGNTFTIYGDEVEEDSTNISYKYDFIEGSKNIIIYNY